ncbi:hypothetical protein [Rodentibacter haemolyticus]|uniref:Beta-methylgalactoside transporter n=1 Tax=Rodentibacter haemolyticus TaxID=2778911 RepID=A0ABX6UYQ9_9PAST|nr:hypothetical protein [Rodentibacter haemolyticus]QPB43194.1 hypothetical protein IHV77_03555 [Rodentibacter haemolyticus]
MNINFTQVLQDSWNFFRNQQKTMLRFVSILFMVQVASVLLSPPLISQEELTTGSTLPDLTKLDVTGFLLSFSITQLATTFIGAWGITTIHQISRQNYRTLGQSFNATLPRFIGVVILEVVVIIPLLLGLVEITAAAVTQASPSIISLFAIIFGIYFFVRLNLSATHYLTAQTGIGQSLKTVWLQGMNKKGALFIYALLIYVVVPILIFQIVSISNNIIFAVTASILAALINIFVLIVTYRFYSLFMQEQ